MILSRSGWPSTSRWKCAAGKPRSWHLIERWRERLIDGGDDVLGELLVSYPQADRQRLRQLVRQAGIEKRENRAPAAQRAIFQALKALIRGDGASEAGDALDAADGDEESSA